MLNDFPLDEIARTTSCARAEYVESVQTLWSDYGELARIRLHGGRQRDGQMIVVKYVCPTHEPGHKYGWSGNVSHQRKLKSYQVEQAFYSKFAGRCPSSSRVPKFIASSFRQNACGQLPSMWIAMEDLDAAGFSIRKHSVNDSQLHACLQWLANFHAKFISCRSTTNDSASFTKGLWPIGTYWHLATRQDEWNAMEDGPLKKAAAAIDDRLNSARFQTIVHGDAKLANFCFSHDNRVAAVDFQYVGGGCGIKDVAYFISSCFSDQECEHREIELLELYFRHLRSAVADGLPGADLPFSEIEEEWRSLYTFAWADFYRFLNGWSPGHWKIHGYSKRLANQVLQNLNLDR